MYVLVLVIHVTCRSEFSAVATIHTHTLHLKIKKIKEKDTLAFLRGHDWNRLQIIYGVHHDAEPALSSASRQKRL